jgi:hypothetical protein
VGGDEEGKIDLVLDWRLSFQIIFLEVDLVDIDSNSFYVLDADLQLDLVVDAVLLLVIAKGDLLPGP